MSNKRYRIIAPIPGASKDTILELEGGFYYPKDRSFFLPKEYVEKNGFWFSEIKEPERIEVAYFNGAAYNGELDGRYVLVVSEPIPKEKYPLIKKAIEMALNEQKVYMNLDLIDGSTPYSEDDVKDAIKCAAFKDPKSYSFSQCQSDYDVAEQIFNQWKSQRK